MLFEALGWAAVGTLVLTAVYMVAWLVMSALRSASQEWERRLSRFWNRELTVTTWVLALPGLFAAATGLIVLIGAIPLAFGIAILVIATRVDTGKRTTAHAVPLVFVIVADVFALWMAFSDTFWEATTVAAAVCVVIYMGACTANAVRIFRRGRAKARALADGPLGASVGLEMVGPPPPVPPLPSPPVAEPPQER